MAPAGGLAVAIRYLEQVRLSRIRAHERLLTSRTHELLQDIEGLRLLGPAPDEKGGIVSFVVRGIQPYDVAMALDEQGVAVRMGHHCAMPLHQRLGLPTSVRASFYLYNTLAEVAQFVEALRAAWRVLRPR